MIKFLLLLLLTTVTRTNALGSSPCEDCQGCLSTEDSACHNSWSESMCNFEGYIWCDEEGFPTETETAELVEADETETTEARDTETAKQGVYVRTRASGWSNHGIIGMFSELVGYADIIYVTFFEPSASGLQCAAQSPCTSVWDQKTQQYIPAYTIYAKAIDAVSEHGIKTLLSVGGSHYSTSFSVLVNMTPEQMLRWASGVKAWVDRFHADGIDINYEAKASTEWQTELIQTRVFMYLRKVMPSPKYLITFTIGAIAAASGTPFQVQNAFSPPLQFAYETTGIALPTLTQFIHDIDYVQLKTYDSEPNMDPRVCMALAIQALQTMGLAPKEASGKLLVGIELGEQYGLCQDKTTGWCDYTLPLVESVAYEVSHRGYRGLFYSTNSSDSKLALTFYSMTKDILSQHD